MAKKIKPKQRREGPPQEPIEPAIKREMDLVQVLLDFCNVQEWDYSTLLSLHQRHPLGSNFQRDLTSGVWPNQVNEIERLTVLGSKLDPLRFYVFGDHEEVDVEIGRIYPGAKGIFPSSPEFVGLLAILCEVQAGFRLFLDKCTEGHLDYEFIVDSLDAEERMDCEILPSSNTWEPDALVFRKYHRIEGALATIVFIMIVRRRAKLLSKIGKCPNCQKYFIKDRDNKKHCSNQCKSLYNNRLRRDSGEHADYMRRKRTEEGKWV